MNDNPFDVITHTIKLEFPRWLWDKLLEDQKLGWSIKECIGMGLHQLHDLRIILEEDEDFKEIYDGWKDEWRARRHDVEDALADANYYPIEDEWYLQ